VDILILAADCCVNDPDSQILKSVHSGCDRSAEDVYSPDSPYPTIAFVEGPCLPTLDFVFVFWIMITFDTLLTLLFHTRNIVFEQHCHFSKIHTCQRSLVKLDD
jgi:hypothetical protein